MRRGREALRPPANGSQITRIQSPISRVKPSTAPRPLNRPFSSFAVFHLRRRSLLRGNLLVLGSLVASFLLSGFPHSRATLLLIVPACVALYGMFDTVRCVQPRWNLYHGGVILLLLMDLMAVYLIFFFLLFPYVV